MATEAREAQGWGTDTKGAGIWHGSLGAGAGPLLPTAKYSLEPCAVLKRAGV